MARWFLIPFIGLLVACSKIPFESNASVLQTSSTRQLHFSYPIETSFKDEKGNPSFPSENLEEPEGNFSEVFGIRFLELVPVSNGPHFINPTHRGVSSVCLENNCSQVQNLFSYNGYGPTVIYGVQVISSQSCPAEDELLRWTNIGILPKMQTLCVGYFKKTPDRASHMQYVRDLYLTRGGQHQVEGVSCRLGYQSVANFVDCLDGQCEGNQLLCVEYGNF